MKTRVILLNGPSSAGKSSLSAELKRRLGLMGEDAAIVSLDDHMTIGRDEEIWEDDVFDVMPRMCAAIEQELRLGRLVIIDHVITSQRIFEAVLEAAKGSETKKIKVSCSLETLKRRVAARGDRVKGSAEASYEYLYPKEGYDLCLDSGSCSAAELADRILSFVD